nr:MULTISPECIES: hypothetical protein [Gammaproteobacteria]
MKLSSTKSQARSAQSTTVTVQNAGAGMVRPLELGHLSIKTSSNG